MIMIERMSVRFGMVSSRPEGPHALRAAGVVAIRLGGPGRV
jgi:3-isopropylmalate dehydratase small subunit